MKKDILYDIEDDAIDRGDSTNLKESGMQFTIENVPVNKIEESLNEKIEADYHNTYYKGKGVYGTRTLRMSNKEYHKLNG